MSSSSAPRTRHLVIVLGDQLDLNALALRDFDVQRDRIWMAEVAQESTHVPSSKIRIALFLSAMRHFAQSLREKSWPLHYTALDDPDNLGSIQAELNKAINLYKPEGLCLTAPGDWRVWQTIKALASAHGLPLQVHEDQGFFTTVRDFATFAKGRKQLRMEYWYRQLRERFNILMENGQPVGGQWNFDAENRASFGKRGPPPIPAPTRIEPDAITRDVLTLVNERFASHSGQLTHFAWPVTREQSLQALAGFIEERLPDFGLYGCDVGCRAVAISLPPVGSAEPEITQRARGGRCRCPGLSPGSRTDCIGRRLCSANSGLAGVCPGYLLDPNA